MPGTFPWGSTIITKTAIITKGPRTELVREKPVSGLLGDLNILANCHVLLSPYKLMTGQEVKLRTYNL
jgi:hypothetical protein